MARRQVAVPTDDQSVPDVDPDLFLDPDAEEETRDRPFDPWRRPADKNAEDLIDWVIRMFEDRERRLGLRKRKRRPDDDAIMKRTITGLICDAIHRELTRPGAEQLVRERDHDAPTRARQLAVERVADQPGDGALHDGVIVRSPLPLP